jgi:hypothetical protein
MSFIVMKSAQVLVLCNEAEAAVNDFRQRSYRRRITEWMQRQNRWPFWRRLWRMPLFTFESAEEYVLKNHDGWFGSPLLFWHSIGEHVLETANRHRYLAKYAAEVNVYDRDLETLVEAPRLYRSANP